MAHWHCESRGYLINAVHPNTPAVETWKTDHPISYILNDNKDYLRYALNGTGSIQVIEEVNSMSKEVSRL